MLYNIFFVHLTQYESIYLDVFSILAILCAILVIINKNPIVSVLFLICLFVLISGYLIMSGMNFIGISYLLVYIGAVSILFLFILMLINIRISEIQVETSNSLPLAIVLSIALYTVLQGIIPFNTDTENPSNIETNSYLSNLTNLVNNVITQDNNPNFLVSNQWDTNLIEILHITNIGNVLYTNYFIWLILASIILLLAMVGTIVITIKQN